MLKEIYVKDFILIDELQLSFDSNLSVFTGETGAGKSILIDAISLLCGNRANGSYVKQGKDKTIIEGVFDLPAHHPFITQCNELGIDCDEMVTITREITQEGKSSARINRRIVPVSQLKLLMSEVVDIHSQHDSQYLLNSRYHLQLLDEFIPYHHELNDCKAAYRAYAQSKKDLELLIQGELNEDDLEFLKFQLDEIERAQLSVDEEDELLAEQKRFSSFEKMNSHLNEAYQAINGSGAALEKIYAAAKELSSLSEFDDMAAYHQQVLECYYNLEETCSQMSDTLNHLDFNEQRFNEVQERLYTINHLKRKYGGSVERVLEKSDQLRSRIYAIEHRQSVLEELEMKVNKAYEQFEKAAQICSQFRKKQAKELEKLVIQECNDLYLNHTRFEVHFEPCEAHSLGLEQVEFYISMNPGEPCKSLAKVASGGELSRLMLGLKTIFTRLTAIQTLIFDEIDTGVSGKVALAIGKKMQQIAKHQQVFAITHLAPVAACGRHHYLVEKHQSDTTTTTDVVEIKDDQRIEQLALIASNSTSESAKDAASELLKTALN